MALFRIRVVRKNMNQKWEQQEKVRSIHWANIGYCIAISVLQFNRNFLFFQYASIDNRQLVTLFYVDTYNVTFQMFIILAITLSDFTNRYICEFTFLWFIGWQTTWDVGRTREGFVNHLPVARDLRILLVFFQHPACFISL